MKREGTTTDMTLAEGRYAIERQLGAGGMGTVWLARDTKLSGRLVAVKLLRAELASGTCLARFKREARIMARLDHPGLVRIFDVRLEGPEPFIVQEFVEGCDLAMLLARSGPLPPASCLRLARELAEALACLHAQGVVHRDVKPSNVMQQSDGRFRLTDLGLALAQDSTRLTRDETMLGTLLYMAPEAVLGVEQGTGVDVYALGLTLWEAAMGRHPHAGHLTVNEYMQRLVANKFAAPPPPAALDAVLAKTMTACMQPDPELRPRDGAAVLRLLDDEDDDSAAHAPVQAPSVAVATGPRGAALRPAVTLAFGLFLALVLFLVLAREPGAGPSPAEDPTRPATTAAPRAPVPAPLPPPRVRGLLDGLRLDLPRPPAEGTTARLMSSKGALMVERPFRGATVTLSVPGQVVDEVRWTVTGPEGEQQGTASAGPRLLFGPVRRPHPDERSRHVLPAPPVAVGDRLMLPEQSAVVRVLRLRRRPGELPALTLETSRRPAAETGRLAALSDRGEGHLVGLTRGFPCGILLLPPDLTRALSYEPIMDLSGDDALGTALPGGGSAVAALTGRPFEGTTANQITVGFWPPPPATAQRCVTHLSGTRLLALQPMGPETVLVAWVDGRQGQAAVITCRDGKPVVLGTAQVPPPAPRQHAGIPEYPGLTLPDGAAALALDGTLVLADADGTLRVLPLGLPPLARAAALVPGAPGSLYVLAGLLPASPILIPVDLHPVAVDLVRGSVGTPGPAILRVNRRVERLLPMAWTPLAGDEILLFAGGVVAILGPPPALEVRQHREVPGEDPAGVFVVDGTVLLAGREGRVHGFELERH